MAISEQDVQNWFEAHPSATPQEVASAIQSVGGLEANAGLADIVSQHYGVSGADVGTAYNQMTALTPDIATNLMQRSMTTGVPTSEFDKYGGYDAVQKMYNAGGGQYSLSSIPQSNVEQYADQIANTGIGNLSALSLTDKRLTDQALANMKASGIEESFINNQQNQLYANQLASQTNPLKTNIANILADKSISMDEANAIQAYQNQYNFKPEDIAKATGYSVETIKQLLGAKDEITNKQIANTINANTNNPVGLADYAVKNGLTAKQMADNSGGKFTEAQAQDLINKSQNLETRLQILNPTAYNWITNISQNTANEAWGGKVQPYQYQIFTPLDTKKVDAPKQLEKEPAVYRTIMGEDNLPVQQLVSGGGFKGVMSLGGDSEGNSLGYVSTTPTYINQIPVVATYDGNGKLTGYQQFKGIGGELLVTATGGKGYVSGKWDASGNPDPQKGAWGSGGGMLGELASGIGESLKSLGPVWAIAKLANPELSLVDVATSLGQGKLDLGTIASGLSGYGGLEGLTAGENVLSGIDLGSDVNTAYNTAIQNANLASTASRGLSAIAAANAGNLSPLISVGLNETGLNQIPEVATATDILRAKDAIDKGNLGGLLTVASNLTDNPDLRVAGAATNVLQSVSSGRIPSSSAINTLSNAVDFNASDAIDTIKNNLLGGDKTDVDTTTQPVKTPEISEDTLASLGDLIPASGYGDVAQVPTEVTTTPEVATNVTTPPITTQATDQLTGGLNNLKTALAGTTGAVLGKLSGAPIKSVVRQTTPTGGLNKIQKTNTANKISMSKPSAPPARVDISTLQKVPTSAKGVTTVATKTGNLPSKTSLQNVASLSKIIANIGKKG